MKIGANASLHFHGERGQFFVGSICSIVGYSQADAHSASTAWGFNLISHTKCNVIVIINAVEHQTLLMLHHTWSMDFEKKGLFSTTCQSLFYNN